MGDGIQAKEMRTSLSTIIRSRRISSRGCLCLSSFNSRRCCDHADQQPHNPRRREDGQTLGRLLTELYRLPLRETKLLQPRSPTLDVLSRLG
jgi:hypothetical protein